MLCVSVHQPWATLIAFGEKTAKTAPWGTAVRGRVGIHAALAETEVALFALQEEHFRFALARCGHECYRDPVDSLWRCDLPLGCLVGSAEVEAVAAMPDASRPRPGDWRHATADDLRRQAEFRDGTTGPMLWLFRNAAPLEKPVPCPGDNKLFSARPRPGEPHRMNQRPQDVRHRPGEWGWDRELG